ncbi:hypothetical protein [Tropicibacter sp. S64]|uniref:hypothetical protein n=1 Tax=Tropicibacter sp. S64 TaxID=3415122 RepID=UPI003C7BF92F
MLFSLAIPAALLMLAAMLAVRVFERVLPESIPGLGLNAALSALCLWALATVLFALLYHWRGAPLSAMFGASDSWRHLAGIGLKSGLIWGPMIVLTLSTVPRRWKHAVW